MTDRTTIQLFDIALFNPYYSRPFPFTCRANILHTHTLEPSDSTYLCYYHLILLMALFQYAQYSITPRLMNLLATIHHRLGEVKARHLQRPSPELERAYRVSIVHATLAVEGNAMDTLPVAELVAHPTAAGSPMEALEVINTQRVYELLPSLDPSSAHDLRHAHGVLMHGLSLDAGIYRTGSIDVLYGDPQPLRTASAENLAVQVEELLHHADTTDAPPLLTSCVLHFGLVYLRPFAAGNGRLARLWQRRLLMEHWPVFSFLPIEAFLLPTQPAYHASFEYADRTGDPAGAVIYLMERIDEALAELLAMPDPVLNASERVALYLQETRGRPFGRKDYMTFFPALSTASASRDLAQATTVGTLIRQGDKRNAMYSAG